MKIVLLYVTFKSGTVGEEDTIETEEKTPRVFPQKSTCAVHCLSSHPGKHILPQVQTDLFFDVCILVIDINIDYFLV